MRRKVWKKKERIKMSMKTSEESIWVYIPYQFCGDLYLSFPKFLRTILQTVQVTNPWSFSRGTWIAAVRLAHAFCDTFEPNRLRLNNENAYLIFLISFLVAEKFYRKGECSLPDFYAERLAGLTSSQLQNYQRIFVERLQVQIQDEALEKFILELRETGQPGHLHLYDESNSIQVEFDSHHVLRVTPQDVLRLLDADMIWIDEYADWSQCGHLPFPMESVQHAIRSQTQTSRWACHDHQPFIEPHLGGHCIHPQRSNEKEEPVSSQFRNGGEYKMCALSYEKDSCDKLEPQQLFAPISLAQDAGSDSLLASYGGIGGSARVQPGSLQQSKSFTQGDRVGDGDGRETMHSLFPYHVDSEWNECNARHVYTPVYDTQTCGSQIYKTPEWTQECESSDDSDQSFTCKESLTCDESIEECMADSYQGSENCKWSTSDGADEYCDSVSSIEFLHGF